MLFSSSQINEIVVVALAVVIALAVYMISYQSKQYKLKEEGMLLVEGGVNNTVDSTYKVYDFLQSFVLTRGLTKRIEKIYTMQFPGDVKSVRDNTVHLTLTVFGIDVILTISALFFRNNMYVLISLVVLIYAVTQLAIGSKAEKMKHQLLSELSILVDDIRFFYMARGVGVLALDNSMDIAPSMIKLHALKMLDILNSDDVVGGVEDYSETSPSIYLTRLLSLLSLNLKNGDKVVNKESVFSKNLRFLKNDIENELLKIESIEENFKLQQLLCFTPTISIPMTKTWAVRTIPDLQPYYNGSYGVICMAIVLVVMMYCYVRVKNLQESFSMEQYDFPFIRALAKEKVVREKLDNYFEKDYGKTLELQELLHKVGSKYDEYEFTVKRWMVTGLTVLGVVAALFSSHLVERNRLRIDFNKVTAASNSADDTKAIAMAMLTNTLFAEYLNTSGVKMYNNMATEQGLPKQAEYNDTVVTWLTNYFATILVNEDTEIPDEIAYKAAQDFYNTHTDTEVYIAAIAKVPYKDAIKSQSEDIQKSLATITEIRNRAETANYLMDDDLTTFVAEQVAKRMKKYQNEYFHWYELVIGIIAGIVVHRKQYKVMITKQRELQVSMEDEVITYQSLIMSLMHFEQMTIERILKWMQIFSCHFRKSINACIADYPLYQLEALQILADTEPFDPFRRVVQNLKRCDCKGIERSFDNLESTLLTQQERRKQENTFRVRNKSITAQFISILPFQVSVILFMAVPIAWESLSQLLYNLSTLSNL